MRYLKKFESRLYGHFPKPDLPFTFEDIKDFLIEYIDSDKIKIDQLDDIGVYNFNSRKFGNQAIYIQTEKMSKYGSRTETLLFKQPNDNLCGIYLKAEIPHPMGMRGNLDVSGYTIATLQYVFKRFIELSNDIIDTSIFVNVHKTDRYRDPMSITDIKIEFS